MVAADTIILSTSALIKYGSERSLKLVTLFSSSILTTKSLLSPSRLAKNLSPPVLKTTVSPFSSTLYMVPLPTPLTNDDRVVYFGIELAEVMSPL